MKHLSERYLEKVTTLTFAPPGQHGKDYNIGQIVTVEFVGRNRAIDDEWAIRHFGERFSRRGKTKRAGFWAHEPMNSSKTEAYIRASQFTLEEACTIAEEQLKILVAEHEEEKRALAARRAATTGQCN